MAQDNNVSGHGSANTGNSNVNVSIHHPPDHAVGEVLKTINSRLDSLQKPADESVLKFLAKHPEKVRDHLLWVLLLIIIVQSLAQGVPAVKLLACISKGECEVIEKKKP